MLDEDRRLPAPLAAAHAEDFSTDHDGYDFEPYDKFMCSVETSEWWRFWTGNPAAGTAPFRVFGQDGTGGLAAIWVREPEQPIETQPIVFLGSEGELNVVAADLGGYLWLLADGAGPLETIEGIGRVTVANPELTAIAQRYTGEQHRPTASVIVAAEALLPALVSLFDTTVR